MKTTRLLQVLLCCLLSATSSFTQNAPDFICGFDDLKSASKMPGIPAFEEQLRQHLSHQSAHKGLSGLPYVVPVVVHVIHDGGAENIPDAQILAAIDHLNEGFAAQGYFAQIGATVNTQIQFCLAKRDPNGNTTTGITRTQSVLTDMEMETQDLDTKNLIRWDPRDYVNIWVVREITSTSLGPGVAGYALLPGAHGQPEDGMICEARFLGASPSEDAILIHEMGHYLGLYHTFQGGCLNNDCQLDGDMVCDTPPDNATHTTCPFNSCHTDVAVGSPFVTDVDDYTGDFMDYSPFSCYQFFTNGQALRMQGALETIRSSLLNSKGCQAACPQTVVAAFSAAPNPVLAGQTVSLTNASTGANSFSWSENGVEFSQNQNTSRVFSVPGLYTIDLTAGNGNPNCNNSTQVNIAVECPLNVQFSSPGQNAAEGETVLFTNATTGAGPINYEWRINGQPVGTTQDLSYLFTNAGIYNVALRAIGPFCNKEYAIVFIVTQPCGQTESVSISYTSAINNFYTQDMMPLPDGSLIHCGVQDGRPAVTRWDASGNVIWHRMTTDMGGFFDLEPTPDGQILLTGQAGTQFLVAKMDAAGNFTWYKKLNLTANFPNGDATDVCAANPDGSFGLFVLDGFNAYLIKAGANGSLLWSRRLPNILGIGGLRVATDGSGDFLLTTSGSFGSPSSGITVLRYNQSGQFAGGVKYIFPNENFQGLSYEDLSVHPEDGGYSIFFTGFVPGGNTVGHKRLVRCAANGSVLWAKRHESPVGLFSMYAIIRHLPDQRGWLVTDYKSNANYVSQGNYLLHISNEGIPLWQRKYGTGGLFDEAIMASEWQDGLIKAVWEAPDNSELRLLRLPDSNAPVDCLPDAPMAETAIPITVLTENVVAASINANLALNDAPAVLANSSLITFPLCSTILPCPEICDNEIDDDQDGYVDCFDADCDCSFSGDCTVSNLPPASISAQLAWESASTPIFVYATPKVANMDPQRDNMPEIMVPSSTNTGLNNINRLYFFQGDGSNQSSPRKLDIPQALGSGNSIAIGDLDGDKIPELVTVCKDALVRIYKNYDPTTADAMQLWVVSNQIAGFLFNSPSLADFDADGVPEVYAGNAVFKLDLSNPGAPLLTRAVFDPFGPVGRNSYSSASSVSTAADLLTPADCNGDPDCAGLELVAGYAIYSIDLSLTDGDGYEIKIQRDLGNLEPSHFWNDGLTAVADMDLDGTPDVVVTGGRDFADYGAYVWNKNGLLRFLPFFYPGATDYEPSGSMPCIANVFDDTKVGAAADYPELLATSKTQLYAFNLNAANISPGNPTWWSMATTDDSGYSGATTFDLDGNGTLEIIYRDQSNLRIMYGGNGPFPAGVNTQRNWVAIPVASGTKDECPIVADVENDGVAEIVVTGASSLPAVFGKLKVFEHVSLPWRPCRNLWNQDNYHVTNVNDDLSIPSVMQKHWLEFPAPGSGKWPINTYLSQRSSLKELDSQTPGIPVPDAALTIDSVRCGVDSFAVVLTICNEGSADLPAQTPLAFYAGNPTTTAAGLLFPAVPLGVMVARDSCRQVTIMVPAAYNQNIYVVVNDNGSAPTPFSLSATTHSTAQAECRFNNNLDVFNFQHQTPVLDLGPDKVLCNNSVVLLSANPDFQRYRWQDGSDAPDLTAYTSGTYWVDAFDGCGFTQSDTLHIVLDTITVLHLPDEWMVCSGETVHLATSGFAEYTWAPADSLSCANCAAVDIVAKKAFTVFVTAANGACIVSDSVRIGIYPDPALQLTPQDGDCATPATITATATGTGPFDFLWPDASHDGVFQTTQPGTYAVLVTDANGCRALDSAAVAITSSLVITANAEAPACANTQTGAIDLTVSGGLQPFQFQWSNNATTEDLTNAPSGTYSVVATDGNGCSATRVFQLTDPPVFQLALQKTDPACAGAPTGALDLTVSGGTGSPTLAWSNSSILEDLTNLSAGVYQVMATDANGCTATLTDTLMDPPLMILAVQPTDPACAGTPTGALDLTAEGGTGNLTFAWSNNTSLEDPANLSAGVYTLVATDANGCTATLSQTLTDPPALLLTVQATDPKCAGEATGALDLTASGGTGNLALIWSNTAVSEDINNLLSGIYTVVVTDANGCTATVAQTLNDPPVLQLSLQQSDPACAGGATGALDLTASGGTGNLTFAWSNNTALEDPTHLPAGAYTVVVTDANGCSASLSGTLTDSPAIVSAVQPTNPLCAGASTGALNLTATGGTGALQFLWSNNTVVEDPVNLPAGVYTVVITDANGCTATLTETLTDPPGIQLAVQPTQPVCAGAATGALDLTATGGAGNLVFTWSNNVVQEDISGLPAGTYTALVTDAHGCTATISQVLTDPAALQLGLQTTNPSCAGASTGALNLTASGGTGALQFLWSNQTSVEDPGNLPAGTYTVVATDAQGCTATLTGVLTDPPVLALALQGANLHCPGDLGHLDLSAVGGTPPLVYLWSTSANTEDLNITQGGTYSVTVTDAKGCTGVESLSINVLGMPPVLTLQADTLTCVQTTAVVSAQANLPNTAFLWSGAGSFTSGLAAPTVDSAGWYTVMATDPLGGCTSVGQVWVELDTVMPTLLLSCHTTSIPCDQDTLGLVAVGSSFGPGYSVLWTPVAAGEILEGATSLTPTVRGMDIYTLTITDLSNGCTVADAIDVAQANPPVVAVEADSVRCYGEMNGAIRVVSETGGEPPYLYSLDNQVFSTDTIFEHLATGTYQVYIEDAAGCLTSTTIEVGGPEAVSVALRGDTLVVPGAIMEVIATVHPAGLVPAQVEWLANGLSLANDQLAYSTVLQQNTLFQIRVADDKGCVATDDWWVVVKEANHVYAPNAIYPESDKTANQVFVLFGDFGVRNIASLNIFDRWGDQVFSNLDFQPNDESEGWNGRFRGKVVNPGVYVWVARVEYQDGSEYVLKGEVTVVR